ncbi:hypothetical protein [Streptomyces sp. NPDC057910]
MTSTPGGDAVHVNAYDAAVITAGSGTITVPNPDGNATIIPF